MKIKILIISMLMSCIGIAQNQITGIYSINNFSETLDCNIYFFKTGNYYIELTEHVTSDIMESLVLSFGKFSISNDEVTLIDKVHNYKIQLDVDNMTLIVKQAFGFLKNKRFVFYDSYIGSEMKFISTYENALTLQEERNNYKILHKTLIPLVIGVFENKQGFKLNIQHNNKYKLEFKNIILSEGEWQREGNEMELIDLNLNHSFYILINDKMLISKLLPGDYKGFFLIKNDKKKPVHAIM